MRELDISFLNYLNIVWIRRKGTTLVILREFILQGLPDGKDCALLFLAGLFIILSACIESKGATPGIHPINKRLKAHFSIDTVSQYCRTLQ